jgi:hypothetical protein
MSAQRFRNVLFFSRNRPARTSSALLVERLEDRTLLNNRFIVPPLVPVDGISTFHNIGDALLGGNGSSLHPGDIIQIEPGSTPGALEGGLEPVQNLTIQGDPAVDAAEIPPFDIFDTQFVVGPANNGLILKNLRVDVVGGPMIFIANATIDHSIVTNYFPGNAILFNTATACIIRNSQIVNSNGVDGASVIDIVSVTGGQNQITGNVFVDTTGFKESFVTDATGIAGAVVNDLIANNSFVADALGGASALIKLTGPLSGVTIQNNTLTNFGQSQQTAITVGSYTQNTQIIGNRIDLTGFGATGIQVESGQSAQNITPTTATIALNRITTDTNGTGIEVSMNAASAPPSTLSVKIEGNVFGVNQHCVKIDSMGGSVADVDLGSGPLHSRGANNFRGVTAADGAVDVTALAPTGPIAAKGNLFSVADPESVIHDNIDDSTLATVLPTNFLTGNAAYVEVLYLDFLHRVGDTSNPADAGSWVLALNNAAPASSVAAGIIRSPEALGIVVDDLYRRLLDRDAGAGRAGWINFLQTGGTLEAAKSLFITSPEYHILYGSDGAFVQSVYNKVLERQAVNSEVTQWESLLPNIGRVGLANDVLASVEYRTLTIKQYYSQILRRTAAPSTGEVAGWVNSGQDLLSIEVIFAGTGEFQMKG